MLSRSNLQELQRHSPVEVLVLCQKYPEGEVAIAELSDDVVAISAHSTGRQGQEVLITAHGVAPSPHLCPLQEPLVGATGLWLAEGGPNLLPAHPAAISAGRVETDRLAASTSCRSAEAPPNFPPPSLLHTCALDTLES